MWYRSFRIRNPGIVIIRRILRSWTANTLPPRDKQRFCQELPANRRGIHRKSFVCGLPTLAFHGINSDFAGYYQLIDEQPTRKFFER
jgi:hypothetical protein